MTAAADLGATQERCLDRVQKAKAAVLTLAVLVLLAPSAQASSATHVLAPAAQGRALAIALNYWRARDPQLMPGGLPTCGRPRIRWAPLRDAGGEALPTGCQMVLSSTTFELPIEAPLVCETILHETGHLLGLAHSPNAYSPMFWDIWRIVPECQRFSITSPQPGIANGVD